MAKKKTQFVRSEIINGFEITYESEDGHVFAVGYCPICGQKESSIQHGLDPGPITAGKLTTHTKLVHGTAPPDSN
jgi:hypothetical protein